MPPGWKIIKRSLLHQKCLVATPNSVGRTLDQNIMHCWGQRPYRVNWGQPEVKMLTNVAWPPNLKGRSPVTKVLMGLKIIMQESARANHRSNCFWMFAATKSWVGKPCYDGIGKILKKKRWTHLPFLLNAGPNIFKCHLMHLWSI